MKKKFFVLTMMAMAMSLSICAQSGDKQSVLWSYCDDGAIGGGVGAQKPSSYEAVIFIPAEEIAPYEGKQITEIRAGLTAAATNLYPIISTKYAANEISQDGVNGKSGWNNIKLNQPYTIGKGDLYVGYGCTGGYVIGFGDVFHPNGNMLSVGSHNWYDYAAASGWGALNIRMKIEGTDLPFDMRLLSINKQKTTPGGDLTFKGSAMAMSPVQVKSYEVELSIDGKVVKTQTISSNSYLTNGSRSSFSLTAKAPEGVREYTANVRVSAVNGQPDGVPANSSLDADLVVYDETYPRTVLVEEGTGTWCRWCVRGIVGVNYMDALYPDQFVCIAVHSDDEMADHENYGPAFSFFPGFPSAVVNRDTEYMIDPNQQEMQAAYTKLNKSAIATLSADALVADDDFSYIVVKSSTHFALDSDHEYRFAYVVVEDEVGPYLQTNGYSGGGNGTMGGFEKKGSQVSMTYDHVARGIYDSYYGVKGSVPAHITKGEEYSYTYKLNLPNNIQDKKNVKVVVLLINQMTGEIINAKRCTPVKDTSVSTLVPDACGDPMYYDLNGRQMSTPADGFQIIRRADGSASKVLVR